MSTATLIVLRAATLIGVGGSYRATSDEVRVFPPGRVVGCPRTVTIQPFLGWHGAPVATVATGGTMAVSSSQLVHGSATDPFPCDGHDMHCTGPHAQAVTLSGPASINTNAPLICPPGGGDCLYGHVDMASCLADIATGMSSCFVYLQHDSPAMRTLSVSAGQYFEVHGQASGAAAQLALHADWSVAGSGSLLLGTLQLGGGSGSGGTLSLIHISEPTRPY